MSANQYDVERHSTQVRVLGGDVEELTRVLVWFSQSADERARWTVDGDALVLEQPGEECVQGGASVPA